MMLTLSDALMIAVITGAFACGGAWAAVRVELRHLRSEVRAAHRRLDRIGAPAAWSE